MKTIADLPLRQYEVPGDLKYAGKWVDNEFSNMKGLRNNRKFQAFGLLFTEVENLFVACKTRDQAHREIASKMWPHSVKKFGRNSIVLREDWERVCVPAMHLGTWLKWQPNTPEGNYLVDLHQRESLIVEFNNWGDSRWGAAFKKGAKSATGKNVLGALLELRGAELCGEIKELYPAIDTDFAAVDDAVLLLYQEMLLADVDRVLTLGKSRVSEWRPTTAGVVT